ncbi:Efflux pump periplasmic linker BepD precursor [Botrimarina colliarenosi]|uniref:Efflux pump periplasmic linker BepD n=1 Tax=Botrimarina colliarenosi TaxID=2528001 RepID=A0A5C5ZZX6_9BACT|nr:efflux RND transporter periplasmic adaptor subunit [Botrimarina colliarenosi]TWT92859.1 Efflux pump periplasmic linker BepD precursor [Botrimarina colliarenosi]
MTKPTESKTEPGRVLLRLAIPCAILLAGWLGFVRLAGSVEVEPPAQEEEVMLRTRVEELKVVDFPVIVRTNAVVQPHNRVTLAAEIGGVIVKVSPSFEVGAYFEAGEVLVEIDPRNYQTQLAISKAQLAAARSALELTRLTEERKLELIESNAVSKAEVDAASAAREQAEADVDLARSQVKQAELNLTRTKVLAPFDGRVQSKLIGQGQMAGANSALGEVFAIDFAEVRLPISGRQRTHLRLPEFADDPPVNVTLRDAIVVSDDQVWRGIIVRTEGVLDENSRDLFAIARIDDPFGRRTGAPPLRIGQPVIAEIEGEVLKDVVALPRGAVRQLDKIVLVDSVAHTLLPMNVQPLWSDADHVLVRAAAIPEGNWLATTAMTYTPIGSKVEIIPAPDSGPAIADSGSAESTDKVAN